MKLVLKPLFLFVLVASFALTTRANEGVSAASTLQDEIVRVDDWTLYKEFGGIRIDHKFEDCTEGRLRNQCVIFFRFTNTTNKALTLSWGVEIWMDYVCKNCEKLDSPEYNYSLTLQPGEVVEGSQENSGSRALFLYSHWHNLIPGMTDKRLTAFDFINLRTEVAK